MSGGGKGKKINKQTEAEKDASAQNVALGTNDPWSTEHSADERMNYAEKYYGFTITAEERAFYRSLDEKDAKARSAGEKRKASSKKQATPDKMDPVDDKDPKSKKPPKKKRPLQSKVAFISMLEEALDEDGDVVPRGQKGGDAFGDHQREMADSLDRTLDKIVSDRVQQQQLDSLAAASAELLIRQQKEKYLGAFAKPPEMLDIAAETQPSALYHPFGVPLALIKPDQSTDDPHFHVPLNILESLQQVQEYDNVEIEFMQPLMRGDFKDQMNGNGLDICECIDWIESHIGIDFWRAVIYHAATPESYAPPPPSAHISLDSLFLTEEDNTPWYATWIQTAILQQLKLPDNTMFPTLDYAIAALDFILDQKSHFLIRFVYLASTFPNPDHSHLAGTILGSSFLTPVSAFSAALKALDVEDPGSSKIVERIKALQSVPRDYDYNNFGASSSENYRSKRPLSLFKGTFGGYYYHIPKELKTQRDEQTHSTIHREFVFTS